MISVSGHIAMSSREGNIYSITSVSHRKAETAFIVLDGGNVEI